MDKTCEDCVYHDAFTWACCNGESEHRADFVNRGCEYKELKMEKRNLDGVYFRIRRVDEWDNICFSDLTEEEQDKIMDGRDEVWLKSMCKILAKCLRNIGDQFDIKSD